MNIFVLKCKFFCFFLHCTLKKFLLCCIFIAGEEKQKRNEQVIKVAYETASGVAYTRHLTCACIYFVYFFVYFYPTFNTHFLSNFKNTSILFSLRSVYLSESWKWFENLSTVSSKTTVILFWHTVHFLDLRKLKQGFWVGLWSKTGCLIIYYNFIFF